MNEKKRKGEEECKEYPLLESSVGIEGVKPVLIQ
jgi:hypothetical protein